MSAEDPTRGLPERVEEGLRTAESLRAEVAGLTAERDALRAELDQTSWERDNASIEAAYLRDDIIDRWHTAEDAAPQRIGLLLTSGDVPPPPPDDREEDISLVSLNTGAIYVRQYPGSDAEWAPYGQGHTSCDYATLSERGPWVTVSGWLLGKHRDLVKQRDLLSTTIYNARPYRPGIAPWPPSAEDALEGLRELGRSYLRAEQPHAWISGWQMVASLVRAEWADDHAALGVARSVLRVTPHEMVITHQDTCRACGVVRADHIGPAGES